MKNITLNIASFIIILFISSCTKDNYVAPDSTIYGSFYDADTHELVEQDIIQGTQIEYVEKGYSSIQFMVVKTDGTYRNSMMFANEYQITPVRGNFEPVTTEIVTVNGETQLDFNVVPYIRVKNVNISQNGDVIKATFNLQQTGLQNVQKVGMFVSEEAAVGSAVFLKKIEKPIGRQIDENEPVTIEMDVSNNVLKKGKPYYIRVGALIDVPEAKYNYAKTTQLTY